MIVPARLPLPCLMLVTDRSLAANLDALVRDVTAAIDGGVNAVQVREKDLPHDTLVCLTRRIVEAAAGRAVVIVNGAVEAAVAARAAGTHGGEESPPVQLLKGVVPRGMLVGRSVHSLAGARTAAAAGADYLVLGTIFPSRSHPGGATGGVERVREVAAAVTCPVIAIGGIAAGNVPDVMRAGAAGVAVISSVLGTPDPAAAAASLRAAMLSAAPSAEAVPG